MLFLSIVPEFALREVWSTRFAPQSIVSPTDELFIDGNRAFYHEPGGIAGGPVGCVSLASGKPIWRRTEPIDAMTFVAGHVLVRAKTSIEDLSPANGRTVWRQAIEPYHLGPLVVAGRVVAETKAGHLEAFDLGTHRRAWGLDVGSELRGSSRNGAACVVDGALWADTADGTVIKVDGATGRLLLRKPSPDGELSRVIAAGTRVILSGATTTSAWRNSDGEELWRNPRFATGAATYVAKRDEIWATPMEGGLLYRYLAGSGKRVGPPIELGSGYAVYQPLAGYLQGYVLPTNHGMLRMDPTGGVVSNYDDPRGWDVAVAVGKDLVALSSDGIVRLTPGAVPFPRDPAAEARRIVATHVDWRAKARLKRLGRAAIPAIEAAIKKREGNRVPLLDALMEIGDARETVFLFPFADAAKTFTRESNYENSEFREFMEEKADPDWLAGRLLPRLRTANDEGDQTRLVTFLVRSRRQDVTAELLDRLRKSETSIWGKEAIYHGLASSEGPNVLDAIDRLRSSDVEKTPGTETLPLPRSEVQKVLAATFDARMRFYRPPVQEFNLAYGPDVRPFAVFGWPFRLRPVETPISPRLRPGSRLSMPYIQFEPLDLDGTMVRFSADGREATARIGTMIAPLYGTGYEAHLRKMRERWYVVKMTTTWMS